MEVFNILIIKQQENGCELYRLIMALEENKDVSIFT